MGNKTKQVVEYGDFQTPDKLARDVLRMLTGRGVDPASLLEPTCGLGSFLFAGLDRFENVKKAMGADINAQYIKRAQSTLQRRQDADKTQLMAADFFLTDWEKVISELPEARLGAG